MTTAAKARVQLDGEFRARFLWRPHLQVGHLQVDAAPGVEGEGAAVPYLLDARDMDLHWSWLDLWRWHGGAPLRIVSLHASKLDARLLRDKDGHATWQIGDRSAPDDKPASDTTALPQFGSLQLADGSITLDDKVLDTALKVKVEGGEGTAPEGSGYRATVQGRWQKLPLDMKIDSGALLPLMADGKGTAGRSTPALDFNVRGTAGAAKISFKGRASEVFGPQNLDGALIFSGPSLAQVGEPLGVTLPTTPSFELRGRLARSDGIWQLRADSANIGSSRLQGDFRFDPNSTPPKLSGRLGGSRLALADLGPSVGADTSSSTATDGSAAGKAKAKEPADGRVLPDKALDLPSLRAMDADVQVVIDELVFDSPDIAPLQRLKTHLLLADSILKLDALSAVVAGGQFDGSTQLDAREDQARWALDLRLAKVDLAAWIKGLRAGSPASAPAASNTKAVVAERQAARAGGDQPVTSYLTGALTGRVKLAGRGNSTAQILGHMNGDATVMVRDGTISHLVTEGADLDLAQALGVFVKGDKPLPMRCARLDLRAQDGVVKIERGVVDNRDSTILVAGNINLQDEQLALKAQSRPKDFSPFALNSPVTVAGTLGDPSVSILGKKLGLKVVGAAVLAAVVTPVAAVLPFIEFAKEQDKRDQCDSEAASATAPQPAPPATGMAKDPRAPNNAQR